MSTFQLKTILQYGQSIAGFYFYPVSKSKTQFDLTLYVVTAGLLNNQPVLWENNRNLIFHVSPIQTLVKEIIWLSQKQDYLVILQSVYFTTYGARASSWKAPVTMSKKLVSPSTGQDLSLNVFVMGPLLTLPIPILIESQALSWVVGRCEIG